MYAHEFIARFPRRRKNSANDWHVPCPAHDDNPHDPGKFSLHVTARLDRVLLHCFAGCPLENVLAALGLPMTALFADERGTHSPPGAGTERPSEPAPAAVTTPATEPMDTPEDPAPTLEAFAALKHLPVDLLRSEGWRDGPGGLTLPYQNRDGSLFRARVRRSLRPGEGFRWAGQPGLGVRPYGLHRLDDASDQGELWLVEGESDTVTAWHLGLPCLGLPGADTGSCLHETDLAGIDRLFLIHEPDQGGDDFLRTVRRQLRAIGWKGTACIVRLTAKDLSEIHVTTGNALALLRAAQDQATDLFTWADPKEPAAAIPEEPPRAPAFHRAPPPGFIQKYLDVATERTDAPVESHTLAAVCVMSALAGPRVRIPLAYRDDGVRLVMWGMNLVDSTSGRKTTVNEFGLHIIRQVLGEPAVLPWKGSPESFIQSMAQRDGQTSVFARDEYTGLLSGIKKGGYLAGLAQDMIRMYDGLPITMGRTAKMNRKTGTRVDDTDRVDNPYLVTLSAATKTSFLQTASIEDVLDGLLARFTFTTGTSTERPMVPMTDAMRVHGQELVALARGFHERAQDMMNVSLGPGVLEAEWELEKQLKEAALGSEQPDATRPALKRLAETVLKVAGLLAIDRAPDGVAIITAREFDDAVGLSEVWQRTALEIIRTLGRTRFLAGCEAVLATVKAHPAGIKMADLYRRHRGIRQREFDEILNALEAQDEINRSTKGDPHVLGRRPVVVYPGPAPSNQVA